jgi:hypothetical protein
MKGSAINYQQAGLQAPTEPESSATPASMAKLRIFKDHLNETPIIVIFVGSTTFELESVVVNDRRDFITLAAALAEYEMVLTHIDYELLPPLDLLAQVVGARIYVLDNVPDTELTPSQMMAVGGYRHRVDLNDYMTLVSEEPQPKEDSAAPDEDGESDAADSE